MSGVAIVVGGSSSVKEEYATARHLCAGARIGYQALVVNDMIPEFEDYIDHAVTLHPVKLKRDPPHWLRSRAERGLPPPGDVWCHRDDHKDVVTRVVKDHWSGSSGLFAVKIALYELGCDRVILCGVPMTEAGKHFNSERPWKACPMFARYWNAHIAELGPYVRSFSGWTREILGPVTLDFLLQHRNGSALPVAARVAPGAAAGLQP